VNGIGGFLSKNPSLRLKPLDSLSQSSNEHRQTFPQFVSKKINGIRIDWNGEFTPFEVLKEELANQLQLPLRDLRIVDPSYPSQVQAVLITRPNVILFSLNHIKMVIKSNEVFIFNHSHEEVMKFISLLRQQLSKSQDLNSNLEPFLHTFLTDESYPLSILFQRFEHVVLEIALYVVVSSLGSTIRSLEPDIAFVLADLRAVSSGLDVIQTQVDKLLPLKNQLDEFRKCCIEIRRCLNDVLHSDEDLEMLFLSSNTSSYAPNSNSPTQPLPPSSLPLSSPKLIDEKIMDQEEASEIFSPIEPIYTQLNQLHERPDENTSPSQHHDFHEEFLLQHHHQHQHYRSHRHFNNQRSLQSTAFRSVSDPTRQTISVELLLENYFNEVEWILSKVDNILNEIKNTEENVVLQLDLIRNRILKFELFLSISTFVISTGSLITGLFGMNLFNHYELHHNMFYYVSLLIFTSMFGSFAYFVQFAKKEKLL
jgi:Mg2+ and Co2+ transporter CorA